MRDPDPLLPGVLHWRDTSTFRIPKYEPGPPVELAVATPKFTPTGLVKSAGGRKFSDEEKHARAMALVPFGLGKDPDTTVAERTGFSANMIRRYRILLGMEAPPYEARKPWGTKGIPLGSSSQAVD